MRARRRGPGTHVVVACAHKLEGNRGNICTHAKPTLFGISSRYCRAQSDPIWQMVDEGRASNFDMALHYALGKLKLCNVELKEQQRVVLKHIYNGNDVFVRLPTGYGKSLCYQLIPFMVDFKLRKCGKEDCGYVVIVVSPLISLMIEQVQRLRERGVSSAILGADVGSTRVPRELLAKEHNIVSGAYKILYSAPEAIIGVQFWREILLRPCLRNAVAAIAIDEAHCVSKW